MSPWWLTLFLRCLQVEGGLGLSSEKMAVWRTLFAEAMATQLEESKSVHTERSWAGKMAELSQHIFNEAEKAKADALRMAQALTALSQAFRNWSEVGSLDRLKEDLEEVDILRRVTQSIPVSLDIHASHIVGGRQIVRDITGITSDCKTVTVEECAGWRRKGSGQWCGASKDRSIVVDNIGSWQWLQRRPPLSECILHGRKS